VGRAEQSENRRQPAAHLAQRLREVHAREPRTEADWIAAVSGDTL
jgi:hypothetical protein